MEHVPFIVKNTSQKPIEFTFSNRVYHPNDYATWRFSADKDISNIDWEAVKDYEKVKAIGHPANKFRLMPGEAISLRNVGEVDALCNPHFNIEDKGLSFDGSLLSLLPGGEMTKGCFMDTFSGCIGLTETPSFSDISEVPKDAFMRMFKGCTNLEKASEIAATDFGEAACEDMFKGCTSLKKPADMPNAKKLSERAFSGMYYGCTSLAEMADCPNVDIIPNFCFCKTYAKTGIEKIKPLPASRVGAYAYADMFAGCTNLKKASEIAATEFGYSACSGMFEDCTSLKKPADMPNAKKLGVGAFRGMYFGCTSLTEMACCPNVDIIPEDCFNCTYAKTGITEMKPLPVSRVGGYAYVRMFMGCKNLEKASEIAATEFGEAACAWMFEDCTSLKSAADMLNAKELGMTAFWHMYDGCTSLTEMKPLPAYRVGYKAYEGMFMGCTSLEKASEIAAKEFGGSACDRMFKDCTSLKKPANMPNCKNTFEDMYEGCPLQPETKKSKNNTKGSKANLKHPILRQGKAKGQSKGLK